MARETPPVVDRGALDERVGDLLDAHTSARLERAADKSALEAVLFGVCWPNSTKLPDDLPRAGQVTLEVKAGESLSAAAERLGYGWSPRWLLDAGHKAFDASGAELDADGPATVSGPIRWDPIVRLPRVEDAVNGTRSGEAAQKRRLAGEVAIASLWRSAAISNGIGTEGADDIRPPGTLEGPSRGALFKNAVVYVLRRAMPELWRVEPELALEKIYGLHLRRDVGVRKSDIVVFDDRDRLVAVVSSKWTWRSDRGTEAAQMVPLRQYRPDVPYVLVTAEFPRLRSIERESVEDRVYNVCPVGVTAALALRELSDLREGPDMFPTLEDLRTEAQRVIKMLDLRDLVMLAHDIRESGRLG